MTESTHFIDMHSSLEGPELLLAGLSFFKDNLVLASSLGAEDQVLTHMLVTALEKSDYSGKARIFVLDTGRLHYETYEVMSETAQKYDIQYEVYFPNSESVEKMVRDKGVNLFYESIENRRECCFVRKVEPLNRALSTADAWITGIRKEQSPTRDSFKSVEWDASHEMVKLNPLLNWTEDKVWDYLKTHDVPYNKLHDQGFPSIGCAPCTRAVEPGEDPRSGRWWWESKDTKECGLHVVDGKLQRFKNVGD